MITKRLTLVLVVLVMGLSSVFLLPQSGKSSPAGIALSLPSVVAEWIGDDVEVTAKERGALAKDTLFARKLYTAPAGDQIFVSVVMSGDDMANSIHRPERCLPAQGWTLQSTVKRTVALRDGKSLDLTKLRGVRVLEDTSHRRFTLTNLNYYWFVGHTEMTSSHIQRTALDLRDRIIHGYNQRWAYITVAAVVTQGFKNPQRTEAETAAMIERFIQELVPTLTRPNGDRLL